MDLKDRQKAVKNQTFFASLRYALIGLKVVFQEEKNMRFHVYLTIISCLFGWLLKINLYEWLWLLFVCFFVIITEMINTALENTIDLITDYHFQPLGKKVKDIAAGAVLLAAIFAIIVAAMILLPKLIALF